MLLTLLSPLFTLHISLGPRSVTIPYKVSATAATMTNRMIRPSGDSHILGAAFGFVVADGLADPDGPVVGVVPGFGPPPLV